MAEDTQFVVGAAKLNARIRRVRESVGDVLRDNREISEFLVRRIKRRFEEEISPEGRPWARLRAKTVQAKRRYKNPPSLRPDKTLQDTRALYDSIGVVRADVKRFTQRAAGTFRIGVTNRRFGRKGRRPSFYGRLHQQGYTHRGGTNVPARPFLGINRLDINAVASMLRRGIIRAIGK